MFQGKLLLKFLEHPYLLSLKYIFKSKLNLLKTVAKERYGGTLSNRLKSWHSSIVVATTPVTDYLSVDLI